MVDSINFADNIFGLEPHSVKGKTMSIFLFELPVYYINVLKEFMEIHKEKTVVENVFFPNSILFLKHV